MIPDFRTLCLFNDICNYFWHPFCILSKSRARGVYLELDDASVMANSVIIKGTGLVFIVASKLKLNVEGNAQLLSTPACIDGRNYVMDNSYKGKYELEAFKGGQETPLWVVNGPCSTNLYAQLVIAE